jgi:hypothetical protein
MLHKKEVDAYAGELTERCLSWRGKLLADGR